MKEKLREIIFGVDTKAGRAFDIVLLWSILISVLVVILGSVSSIRVEYGKLLKVLEWFFTLIFTVEYILRIFCVENSFKYCFSFFGIIDLLSVVPTYLGLFFIGIQSFLVIRVLRLLRIFRVFKLGRYIKQSEVITAALRSSKPKIIVFLVAVLSLVLVLGTLMYMIEGEENGFSSIPRSIYWAIVTMTTVGYGDITPKTILGQLLSSVIMLIGYGMIAVPTGIVSVEVAHAIKDKEGTLCCDRCGKKDVPKGSRYCNLCGEKIIDQKG